MERLMHLTVVTAVLLSVGILNAVSAQHHREETKLICKTVGVVSCGDGWNRINAKLCVKYFQTPKSFADAQEYCNSTGSELVAFQDKDEMIEAVCISYHDNHKLASFWIGVKRSGEGFINTDGSEVEHAEWYPDESENADGEENCITMNHKEWGYLNGANCAHKHNFMCVQTM